jgi:transposase InsO family protein
MKYRFIRNCAEHLPVDGLCSYLEVARSGYYKWLKQVPSRRVQADQHLGEIIEAEFYKHRKAYGSPRMCDRLRELGRRHGQRRIGRLMAERALIAHKKKRFVATTVADPTKQPAPNVLNREFTADGPNRKWVSDITVIPTDEGDLYLAATMDLWSRMIVGWSIRETMAEELVQQAFDMAVQQRWPDPGLLHHCDRGSQYTANGFPGQLRERQAVESNSRKGNVWDNAAMESFFSSVEMELLRQKRFKTKAQAMQEVFIYIEIFYNRQRIHTSLGSRSPAQFETAGGN